MTTSNQQTQAKSHLIFRSDAVNRYWQSQEEAVLPQLVSPRIFAYLWFLLGLVGVSGAGIWTVHVPIYASGTAVITIQPDSIQSAQPILVVFFSPETLPYLQSGQQLLVQDHTGESLSQTLLDVETEIISPAAAYDKFNLEPNGMMAVTQPSAVALASWPDKIDSVSLQTRAGTVYTVDIQIGSRRAISFLPLLGPLLTGN